MLSFWSPGAQKGILESSKRDKKTLAQDQADILRDVEGGRLGNDADTVCSASLHSGPLFVHVSRLEGRQAFGARAPADLA